MNFGNSILTIYIFATFLPKHKKKIFSGLVRIIRKIFAFLSTRVSISILT